MDRLRCGAFVAFVAIVAAVASACGTSQDDRPLELPYLTQAIFAPMCGITQCHSTFVQAGGVVLDTPENVRSTLVGGGYLLFEPSEGPADATLIHWITDIDPFDLGIGRMPFDQPIPNRDVELLIEWIGAGAPGAQCDPTLFDARACVGRQLFACTNDGNLGELVQTCTNACAAGACQ